MDKILYLDHVDQYNRLYGLETLHPLVITARRGGTAYEMADIFPFNFTVTDSRVCTGYRQMNYRKISCAV